jgi:exopolysaccharide biosynthesis polyprenyl glycosylphosphotransferase
MVTDRTQGVRKLSLIFSLAISAIAYWIWMLVYNDRIPLTITVVKNYLFFLEILLLGLVLGFKSKGVDRDIIDPRWAVANRNALRQVAAALFSAFVVITAFQVKAISRLFFFSFAPILYLTLLICHQRLPSLIARRLFRGNREERILLVGSRLKAQGMRSWLKNKQHLGFRTVGILSDDAADGNAGTDYHLLGPVSDLERVACEFGITQVILVELALAAKVLQECIHVCERMGMRLLAVSDLEEQFRRPVTLFEDDGRRFVGLRDEPLEDPLNQFLKRSLDLAISVPVTIFILPSVTLLVWLAQSLQSPGPIFFIQSRVGVQNRTFQIIKYRTMRVQSGDESRQATASDSRTFPAGRWLRKFSLDELPQFFNVMTGQMSIVGPRPHLKQHDEIFSRALNNFRVRAKVKPGITGLAQVRGFRGEVRQERDIIERVNSDIYYLENWSLGLDCYIILQTAGQLFFPPKTAY